MTKQTEHIIVGRKREAVKLRSILVSADSARRYPAASHAPPATRAPSARCENAPTGDLAVLHPRVDDP